MDLDRIRKDYQGRFHVKKNRDGNVMSVEQYKAMIRNLPIERLQQQQQRLLAQAQYPLQQIMEQVKKEVAQDNDIEPKDKAEKIEEKYNDYVKMRSDDALEMRLIDEELHRPLDWATTGSGMKKRYYPFLH